MAIFLADNSAFAAMSDTELKAAYIVRFTEFIEWPAHENKQVPDDHFVICVFGKSPIEEPLSKLPQLTKVHELPIEFRSRVRISQLNECNVLFVPKNEDRFLPLIRDHLGQNHTLVINEVPNEKSRGQMITLYTDDDRLRFEVHLKLTKEAGFKVSSRLLKLARIIE